MHIDKNDLIEFDNGTMNEQELIEFLSHLDHCDSCLDQMIEQENHSPVTAPSYLAEQIMDKAISSEVQFARAANKVSRKVQFLQIWSADCCGRCCCTASSVQYSGYRLLRVKIKLLFCSE